MPAAPRWPGGRFKRQGGGWVPVQQAPVRYDRERPYRSFEEFVRITFGRLLDELGTLSAIEVFSALYALVDPPDALSHDDILGLIEEGCEPEPRRGKWQTFRVRR